MSQHVTLASPEISERHSVDYDGPLNIFYTCECELKSVQVNLRNAVVCRSARPQIMKGSSSLLVFKQLPSHVDHDSFRVEISNHRNEYKIDDQINSDCLNDATVSTTTTSTVDDTPRSAYIHDVRFQVNQLNEDENKILERYNCLLIQLRKEKRRLHFLNNRYQRLSKQQNVLENFSNSLLWNVTNGIKDCDTDNEDCVYDDDNNQATYNSTNTATSNNVFSSMNGGHMYKKLDFLLPRQQKSYHQQQENLVSSNKSHRARSLTRVRSIMKDSKDKNLNPSMVIQNEALQLNQVEAMRNFFTLYTVQSQQLDEDAISVGEELEQCKITINQLTEQLDEIELCRSQLVSKELHVLLESRSSVNPDLEITYTVDHVSWTPCYDIRLSSATATLKIIYYGIIRQSTGEDWELGKLTLSTAEQDNFNSIPELTLEKLSFKNDERRHHIDKSVRKSKARSFHAEESTNHLSLSSTFLLPLEEIDTGQYHSEKKSDIYNRIHPSGSDSRSRLERSLLNGGHNHRSSSAQRYYTNRNENLVNNDLNSTLIRCPSSSLESVILKQDCGSRSSYTNKYYSVNYPSKVVKPTSNHSSQGISTKNYFPSLGFKILKPPRCIRGSGEPHRVTIGTLEFKPKLQYVTIPKQTPKAFLRATMHNISDFALLEGQASVYIDSNFIGKTKLSATAVQEEFTCELGYDPGIRVTYMPRHKYKKTGSFLGSKTMSIIFKQVISVENSYPRSMKLLVIDQLPVSTEEKLKVQLIEPSIKNPDKYDPNKPVRISKTKMVEWDIELAPYETRELVLKYLVEHPAIKDIDISTLGIR
ncbi:unnamed protein product [Trichobilharzia szidati]|nr:unnamed protein product [Trichobilharzia szidati]